MNAIRNTFGFITEIVRHAIRITAWCCLVMIAASLLGVPPVKALAICILANVMGCFFYSLEGR